MPIMKLTGTFARVSAGIEVVGQLGEELLWTRLSWNRGGRSAGRGTSRLVQMRAVAGVLDHHFAVAPAGRGVAREHGPGLRHHGLRRPGLLARPARDDADGAQVARVVQGGVRDDDVVGAAQPHQWVTATARATRATATIVAVTSSSP